jgi:hypothetical protein
MWPHIILPFRGGAPLTCERRSGCCASDCPGGHDVFVLAVMHEVARGFEEQTAMAVGCASWAIPSFGHHRGIER